jgi:hypothetical protein
MLGGISSLTTIQNYYSMKVLILQVFHKMLHNVVLFFLFITYNACLHHSASFTFHQGRFYLKNRRKKNLRPFLK